MRFFEIGARLFNMVKSEGLSVVVSSTHGAGGCRFLFFWRDKMGVAGGMG